MRTARRLSRPWLKKGLLNASVLDLAITVLSRSKNAAVLAGSVAEASLWEAVGRPLVGFGTGTPPRIGGAGGGLPAAEAKMADQAT